MPLKPRKGETQDAFTARCMTELNQSGTDRPQEQKVAICLQAWRDKDKQLSRDSGNGGGNGDDDEDMPDPDDYDDYDEFLPDCMDAGFDEDTCRSTYREGKKATDIVHKTHAGEINGSEYVLSDETPDRMGDIIESGGWDLRSFKSNPIALFGHKSDFPIGRWRNVGVNKDKQLRGHLELAPEGTSPRIDEIRALVKAGILRAVSVGFKPLDTAPLNHKDPFGGQRFSKQELVECSLVAVPANPNALSVAKSLKISDDTQRIVFAKTGKGNGTVQRAVAHGKTATRTPVGKSNNMTPLTQRITDAQGRITALKAALGEHLASVDDQNVTDEQMNQTTEFNNKIVQEERTLAMLVESEKHIAAATAAEHGSPGTTVVTRDNNRGMATRPFSMPAKKFDPIDVLVRGCMVQMYSHQRKTSMDDTRAWLAANGNPAYNDDTTRAYIEWHTKAASAPAMTTVTGWAAELVQTVYAAFMESLFPKSVYPRLAAKGLDLSFGRAGKISIPTRSLTPTIAGSFVGEGAPIPVRQGAFTAQVLTPKKMAVITTWTREMDEHSVPAIEGLLRQAIQDDTAIAIDSVLLDTNAATAVRPAGLLNGVTPLTATAGGGFNALVGDIKQLSGALLTATRGNVRSPAWIMNPQQVMSAGLTPAPASGVFPFDTSGGNLNGWPIIDSGTVPMGTIIAMDAADFVGAGENPRFEISDQATLHFEDTAPLDIVAGTASTPVKSLWQTDSIGLRLILPLNWLNRRPGTVAAIVGVTW
jgi:HK97 family phage prohead protease